MFAFIRFLKLYKDFQYEICVVEAVSRCSKFSTTSLATIKDWVIMIKADVIKHHVSCILRFMMVICTSLCYKSLTDPCPKHNLQSKNSNGPKQKSKKIVPNNKRTPLSWYNLGFEYQQVIVLSKYQWTERPNNLWIYHCRIHVMGSPSDGGLLLWCPFSIV